MSLVSVHTEWDPLEEIIVGTALGARTPKGDAIFDQLSSRGGRRPLEPAVPYPDWLIEETEDDLTELVRLLEQAGVTVHRAAPLADADGMVQTPHWSAGAYFPYCPRDVLLAIGDTLIETPNFLRCRQYEPLAYRHLLETYVRSGTRWISAPRPRLDDRSFLLGQGPAKFLQNVEPIFDAANVLRLGQDLLYQVSCSGNDLGAIWLQAVLGPDYRVHTTRGLYHAVHIDSTIAPLRPGLVLLNPDRVPRDRVPEVFAGWDVVYAPEMVEYSYSDFDDHSSKWLGMNLLMVNPELAFVDAHQVPLMKRLGEWGIECVPVRLRHGRTLGGGVHCVTLDVRRRGSLEDHRRST